MIQVICKSEAYTYNVYHIIKAFFPSEETTVKTEEEASHYISVTLPDAGRIVIGKEQVEEAVRYSGEDMERGQSSVAHIKYWIDICLYREFEKLTGQSLAWGILTGVRPTKIAMQKLEKGWERERFIPWFEKKFQVSRQKAQLSFEIAGRERALLQKLDCEKGYSLYVGIPFCPSVCTYCSFSSGEIGAFKDRVWDYLGALQKELAFLGNAYARRKLI